MTERIQTLTELTLHGKMFPSLTATTYDRKDLLLPKIEMETKRICEYIENQAPIINEYCRLAGLLMFDGSCIGDAFQRSGHTGFSEFKQHFYLKHIDNISVGEWQHATGEYHRILQTGLVGFMKRIDRSLLEHPEEEKQQFLKGLKKICYSIIRWAHKCADAAAQCAKETANETYRANLLQLADALHKVPEHPAETFYEAVLCINLCFSFNPDSFGTLDRYLQEYYDRDIAAGTLTREQAKELLQEFFLTPQNYNMLNKRDRTKIGGNATKGGQSHFCVGGYNAEHEDGCTDLSMLIIESLMDLPTYIPELTFRWTEKTPHETFKKILDYERNDPHKRLAFTNDERRLKALTELCGIPYEKAITYVMIGCNEIALPGTVSASTSKGNILRCIDTLFHKKADLLLKAATFEDFYAVFEQEFQRDLNIVLDYDDKYNLMRARDINYVSSLFFDDCIENAESLTRGGSNIAVSSPMILGIVNLIDSLIVVRQFVYEQKLCTMQQLVDAVQANWEGFSQLRHLIEKKAEFFGNDTPLSNETAQRIYHSFYKVFKGKKTVFGYPILIGDHTGYNEHCKWFGAATNATPDGRKAGDPLKFGLFQRGGRDRNGLTALLNSIAAADPYGFSCGSTVSNISLDETLVRNDDYFEKLSYMLETYFRRGGTHFQLNYVSREELLAAQKHPENHQNLRVRVTGFSEYFVKLHETHQNDIINRTVQK